MPELDPNNYSYSPPPKKRHIGRWIALGVAGFIALIVIISVAVNGGHKNTANVKPAASSSNVAGKIAGSPVATAPNAPASPAVTPPPAAPTTTPPASTAPAMTVSQQQAVMSAQQYLNLGSGFSRAGLIQQLTSSADGFSTADATFAVNYLNPDWNAQAVEAAKSYMAIGGFSRASLIQQLTSQYGDQFTLAQATYAVNQVGL